MNAQLQLRLIAPRPRPAKPRAYFDTTRLPLADLADAIARAEWQDDKVLALFRAHSVLAPSRCQVLLEAAGSRILLTSVRRSISTLTDAGALYRTSKKVAGPWGAKEYLWALRGAA